jgi:hypothetical protein
MFSVLGVSCLAVTVQIQIGNDTEHEAWLDYGQGQGRSNLQKPVAPCLFPSRIAPMVLTFRLCRNSRSDLPGQDVTNGQVHIFLHPYIGGLNMDPHIGIRNGPNVIGAFRTRKQNSLDQERGP